MSETQAPPPEDMKMPDELSQYSGFDAKVAEDGSRRVYGINAETGSKKQLAGDDVLDAYGYKPVDVSGAPGPENKKEPEKEEDDKSKKKPAKKGDGKFELRPVREGEMLDNDEDGAFQDSELPVAAMAHEPWTIDKVEDDDDGTGGKPPEGDGPEGDGPEGKPPGGDTPDDDKDPLRRIGEAVEGRMHEMQEEGSTESEAHADAHDEFWGKKPESGDGGGEDDPAAPEKITSPELEAAEAKVEEARVELARMKAGRERTTFFSREFSKKKLAAAEAAYDKAVSEAGAIAVDLLREKGVEGQELVQAIHFGAFSEVTSLIDKQFDIEKEKSEGSKFAFFYKWWKDQGMSLKGKLMKGGAMAAIGIPIGVGTAIVAAPIAAGAGVAGAVGLGVSRGISKGLVGNAVRRNAEAATVAEGKRDYRREQAQAIYDKLESGNEAATEAIGAGTLEYGEYGDRVQGQVSGVSSSQTAEVKRGNDKRAGLSMAAAAGGAVLGYIGANVVGGWFGGGNPKPPNPGPGYDNAGADRMIGITSARPGAAGQANQFFENLPQGTPNTPQLDQINDLWEGVRDQLNPEQSSVYNQVLGRLSTTEGFGNQWTVNHADEILNLVQQGDSTEEVISKLINT